MKPARARSIISARHGWRKLMPRPFHPRRDIAAQDALKKWLSKCCEESQEGCHPARPPLWILFADEARLGRINRPRQCWAQIGIRQEVASQLIREYIYLYGAVSQKDGTCVYLIMQRSDNGVLTGLSQRSVAKVCQAGYPID